MTDTQELGENRENRGRRRSLSDAQIARARALADQGWSVRDIGKDLGTAHMNVFRALQTPCGCCPGGRHVAQAPLLRGVPGLQEREP